MITLKSFQLKNFKGFEEQNDLLTHQFNLFTGVNSGGKTTIIQALLFIRGMLNSDRIGFDIDEDYQLGDFKDVVFNHEVDREIEIGLELEVRYDEKNHLINKLFSQLAVDSINQPIVLRFTVSLKNAEEKIYVSRYFVSYHSNDRELLTFELLFADTEKRYRVDCSDYLYVFHTIPGFFDADITAEYDNKFDEMPLDIERLTNKDSIINNILRKYSFYVLTRYECTIHFEKAIFPKTLELRTNEIIKVPTYFPFNSLISSDLQSILEMFFAKLSYIGPLREEPKPYYPGTKELEMDSKGRNASFVYYCMCRSGEVHDFVLPPDTETCHLKPKDGVNSDKFEVFVSEWASYILGKQNKFQTDKFLDFYELNVSLNTKTSHRITNVGFGASQIFPILVECIRQQNRIVILEQPEIHIHPNAQARLADFLLLAGITNNLKFIIETHSEHLVNRLVRRMVEDESLCNLISISFVQNKDGLKAELTEIKYDSYGRIYDWPEDFFDTAGRESEMIYHAQQAKYLREEKNITED